MSFLHHGHRSVCILSANGTLSNVTLKHPATSGGTISYEGRFEILSLSGSYLLTESDGQHRISGGLSVCLAGPDGRILGGGVAGALVAASPVQVIAGSFIAQSCKEAQVSHATQPMNAPPPNLAPTGATGAHSPSRGTVSESSAGPPSPLNLSHNSSNPQAMPCRGNEVTKIMTISSSPESQNLLMALDSI
uniref:AT-hook motif nuclear-localized protein n=1 Tax=Kalanchoe fedtschenkoi TaxID=63787 RepID=A0A7N0R853_KALFE